jgi:tetratricopeptide (TPR) repeat protein
MPVHRHRHEKAGSVYAFASELDAWSRSRRTRTANRYSASRRWVVLGLVPAIGAVVLVFGAIVFRGTTPSTHEADRQTHVGVGAGPAARQEYLVGRYYLWRFDEEDLQQAIKHFDRATTIDPACAPAYAALASAWWARALFGKVELNTAALRAHEAAEKAMTLDDRLAAAWAARGDVLRVFDKDAAGAEAMFMHALALDPGSVEAHHSYALLLMGLGRFEQALDHIARAAAADPLRRPSSPTTDASCIAPADSQKRSRTLNARWRSSLACVRTTHV